MKRFLLICLVLLVATSGYCANKWTNLDTAFIDGDAVLFNDIDTNLNNYVIEPLERYLINARQGMKVKYATAATLTIQTGSIGCSNAAGTLLQIRQNTAEVTVTWADIDAAAEQASKTYYVYLVADADATTATAMISLSSTTPTGATYYKRIGSFYNNSSSNIEQVANDDESVIVATGTVADGGTIALPSGYLQDECKWVSGISSLTTANAYGLKSMDFSCSTSRVCQTDFVTSNWVDGTTTYNNTGTGQYIIVCNR